MCSVMAKTLGEVPVAWTGSRDALFKGPVGPLLVYERLRDPWLRTDCQQPHGWWATCSTLKSSTAEYRTVFSDNGGGIGIVEPVGVVQPTRAHLLRFDLTRRVLFWRDGL
jgi:hypothetical protein